MAVDKQRLRQALMRSGEALAQLLEVSLENCKINNDKPHPIGFLGYMISHEAYHHGEICVALTEARHKLDEVVLYDQ